MDKGGGCNMYVEVLLLGLIYKGSDLFSSSSGGQELIRYNDEFCHITTLFERVVTSMSVNPKAFKGLSVGININYK